MTIWQRIAREPNLILGVLTAGLSLAVLFGVNLSAEQLAGIGTFIGTLVALVRFVSTPASEVVAQKTPDQIVPTAGPALEGVENGTDVYVHPILGKA